MTNVVRYTTLGKNGPRVPALGFGLMVVGAPVYGASPGEEDMFSILDRACELGATFWDTSDLYGNCEEVVGKWFKRTGKRNEIFICTKFGFVKGKVPFEFDSTAEYCKKACSESLRLLGIDSIDLYYMHHPNLKTPIEETMRALVELKAEGKIKHIGLSNISANTLRRAVNIGPVAAVQVEYSPFALDIEGPSGTNLLATCRELGVAVVTYSPLGRGLLSSTFASIEPGKVEKDARHAQIPRFMEGNIDKNIKLVNDFKALADRKGCTLSQLSLAWLMKQGDDIIPIPGTKKIKYLEENWAALQVHLTDGEEAEVREFLQSAEVAGSSIPPEYEALRIADTAEAK